MKDKLKMESKDIISDRIEKISELFPNCITETSDENGNIKKAVNFEKLKAMLSDSIADGDESYEFTWVGKKAAIAEANKPIRKTLRPCPEESVNWDTTENLYIEGDNLEVLKLLQESYLGKVKMIYIDPPYNRGNDRLTYHDSFKMDRKKYEAATGIKDAGNKLFHENNELDPRFHSNWCSMIYPTLLLARNLLKNDGVIFISIDDNEQENLKKICDEVFGARNFIGKWNWYKSATPPNLSKKIKKNIEYIYCYERIRNDTRYKGIVKSSSSDNGLLNQTNKFAQLTFPAGIVETKLSDGIYRSGEYGTNSYRIVLHDDVVVKNGKITNEFKMSAKFKWGQENLLREISKGTRISIKTNTFSPSYDKMEYNPEVPPNFIDKQVGVDTTEEAGKSLNELFGNINVFDYPKPVDLIKYLAGFIDTSDSYILDFFSGSATTAHAVMQLNAEDGGHRKFIMVQLPEETDEKSEAYKAGYKNICEIGKERIRRAGTKIREENPLTTENLDIGFRVLRLADSNMTDVYYSPAEYDQSMLDDLESNIKSDRTSLDLLFGCLLEWGLPLSMPYSSEEIEGVNVHTYNDGDLIACFDENISENAVKIIAKRKPLRAVFRDSSFADSPSKINVFEMFKMYAPDTRVKVI